MRVATVSTPSCPRCDAPVQGDYQYCPECAYRLRAPAPEPYEQPPAGGRSGGLLLALGAVVLLAAGYLVGLKILGPDAPPAYLPPPKPQALTVAGLQDHLVLIPPGTATYVRETVYDVPDDDTALQRLWAEFAAGEPLVVDDDPETDDRPMTFQEMFERPEAIPRWNAKAAAHYESVRQAGAPKEVQLPEPKEVHLPVQTQPFLMMTHEVSRGQYAEFLNAVQNAPELLALLARQDWVGEVLWRPPPGDKGRQDYARHYRNRWWQRVAEHHRQDDGREPERPSWLEQDALSDEQGGILLVPPSWVLIDPYGSISWELEPRTEDLPVTDISWWDAHIFVVWARHELGISTLALPNAAQWMRAFHGGHPRKEPDDFDEEGDAGWTWPWGSTTDPNGCNCLNFPPNETTPVLRHVLRRYNWHGGKTVHGVLNMAGNAAEWVDNWVEELPAGPMGGPYRTRNWEYLDKDRLIPTPNAFTAGGSYLAGIDDCGLPLRATLNKCVRAVHVGFRLIMYPVG
jgi:formylglycine-generating enzyme required for sulfatase activity